MGANVTLYLVAGSLWHSLAFGVKKARAFFLSLTEVQSGIIKRTFAARFFVLEIHRVSFTRALPKPLHLNFTMLNSLFIQC